MKITNIIVIPVDGDANVMAYVSMRVFDALEINNMKVIKGKNGYFVSMPAKKMKDGTFKDFVFPIDANARKLMEDTIISEYKKIISKKRQ